MKQLNSKQRETYLQLSVFACLNCYFYQNHDSFDNPISSEMCDFQKQKRHKSHAE